MNNKIIAKKLFKIAEEIVENEEMGVLRKNDPSLKAIVNKVVDATGADVSKMLTIIIMALRSSGHGAEAEKIYNLFKSVFIKVKKIM